MQTKETDMAGGLETDEQTDSLTKTDAMLLDNKEKPVDRSSIKKRIKSLWIIYFSMYMTMLGIAVGISSTWPYLQKIDQQVSPTFLGWTFVSFNVAAIAGDFCFGIWLRYRPNREPMIGSIFVSILSPIIFAFAQGIGGKMGLIAVLISRLLLGFTRGNMTITRSIVSESTTVSERSTAMATLVVAMTLGFASGSGIQALVALMGDRSYYVSALKLRVDLYTIPAFLLVFLGIINIALVFCFVKPTSKASPTKHVSIKTTTQSKKRNITVFCILFFMFGVVNFSLSLMENLLIPFIQHQYALTRPKAVFFGGLLFTSQGLVGCAVQVIAMRFLFKRFTDRFLIIIAYGCLVLNFVLYIPMGENRVKLQGTYVNSTVNSTTQDLTVGCPREFDWCRDTPKIYLPQLIIAAVLFAMGYSSCLGLILSLFTKIIGAGNQSTSVGLISACGNLARLTAPIIGTSSYVRLGPQYTFTWMVLVSSVTFIAFLYQYRSMMPQSTNMQSLFLSQEQKFDSSPKMPAYYVTPV